MYTFYGYYGLWAMGYGIPDMGLRDSTAHESMPARRYKDIPHGKPITILRDTLIDIPMIIELDDFYHHTCPTLSGFSRGS